LNSLGIAYDYIDVDLLPEDEKRKVQEKVKKWNPKGSYPTIVLNDTSCIIGYDEKEIKEALGNGE
jgi:glutaredoxin